MELSQIRPADLIILILLFIILVGFGRLTKMLSGGTPNPRKHPVVQVLKHPSWTPKLREVRLYFQLLYLVQAPALWIIWIQLRESHSAQNQTISAPLLNNPTLDTSPFDDDQDFLFNETDLISSTTGFHSFWEFVDWVELQFGNHTEVASFWTSPQLRLFILQFILYLLWPIIFFRWKRPGWAAIESFFVWCSIALTIKSFWRVDWMAAWCLYPYLSWITNAVALSVFIWKMNRGVDVPAAVLENEQTLPEHRKATHCGSDEGSDGEDKITIPLNLEGMDLHRRKTSVVTQT